MKVYTTTPSNETARTALSAPHEQGLEPRGGALFRRLPDNGLLRLHGLPDHLQVDARRERAVDHQRPIAAGGVTVDEKARHMGRAGQGIRIAPHVAWVYPPGNRIAVAGLTFPLLNLQPEEVIPVQEEAKCHIGEKIMGLRNRDFLPECPVERLEVLRRQYWRTVTRAGDHAKLKVADSELALAKEELARTGTESPDDARKAASIYVDRIRPLVERIRRLKYARSTVRTELREVMMRSKAQYQGRMKKVATESLDLLFGD